MITLIMSFLTVLLLLVSSLMGYIFLLLSYVCLIMITMTYYNFISGLLSLMILLVYVGAMAVLFIYVSAVSPNITIPSISTLGLSFTLALVLLFSGLMSGLSSFDMAASIPSLFVSDEMFTGWGVYLTISLVSVLILVLAAVTFMSPASSTFRSIS